MDEQRVVSILSKSSSAATAATAPASSESSSSTTSNSTSLSSSSSRHLNYWLTLPNEERHRTGAFRKDWLSLTNDGIVVSKEVTSVSGKGIVSQTNEEEDEERVDDILPSSEVELTSLIQLWPEEKLKGFLTAYDGLLGLAQMMEKEEIHCNFGCQELIEAREKVAKLNESNSRHATGIASSAADSNNHNSKTESASSSSSTSSPSSTAPNSSSISSISTDAASSFPSLRDCLTPLPFLLPWPTEILPSDRQLDDRPPNAPPRLVEPSPRELMGVWMSDRTPAEWAKELAGTGYESQMPPFIPPLAVADGTQPIPEDAPQLFQSFGGLVGKNTTLGNLSSIVNGNIWPVSMSDADLHLSNRVEGELRIAAAFVGRLIGIPLSAQSLKESCGPHDFIPGERSGERDARYEDRMGWDRYFAKGFNSVPGDRNRKPLPSHVVQALMKLLPSFLIMTASTSWTSPCPALFVAPIAPGWIGGFISPRFDGESYGYGEQ